MAYFNFYKSEWCELMEILTPLKNRVLIKENKHEIKSEAGLILENVRGNGGSTSGNVIAVGPDVTQVKVGDVVYVDWVKGNVTQLNGEKHVIIEEDHIVAVLED